MAEFTALDKRSFDGSMLISFFEAKTRGDQKMEDILHQRFRPETKVALDAWLKTDPVNNSSAPAHPFKLAEYVQPDLAEAAHLRPEAHRGAILTGLFGGLASSTAVTLALSKQSVDEADQPSVTAGLAAGLLISWTVMFIRVAVAVAVVNAALLWSIIAPIAAMGAATVIIAGIYYVRGRRSSSTSGQEVPLKNPFSLTAAIKFALFFTLIQLIVKLAQKHLPAQSFYAVAALAGLTDVDAITLSRAEYAREGDPRIATTSIVIAAISNTLVKCGLVFLLGARSLALRIAIATSVLLLTGATTLLVPPLKPIEAPAGQEQHESNDAIGI